MPATLEDHLILIAPGGVRQIRRNATLPDDFGMKARGLANLPPSWVPPFVVISSDFHALLRTSTSAATRDAVRSLLDEHLGVALQLADLDSFEDFLLRSNAVVETIEERGRFISAPSTRHLLAVDAIQLLDRLSVLSPTDSVGLLVQKRITKVLSGHLSNARRVAEEYRDAQVQIEDSTGFIVEDKLSHRAWRRTIPPSEGALICRAPSEVQDVLREPLAWSVERERRIHFEWVWDGSFVYIVQADSAEERPAASAPDPSHRISVSPTISPNSLRVFKIYGLPNKHATGKLKKHSSYADAGFWQPPFFALESNEVLSDLAEGNAPEELTSDLRVLTQAPLVLRTSCATTEAHLLPRSDQLTNPDTAIEWLASSLRDLRNKRGHLAGISIIGHHYIPARVAAFTSGSAERLEVAVEALWGMPEGLYYYPFDSYTVVTTGLKPGTWSEQDITRFKVSRRKRWKSHFVAPDLLGHFACHELGAPWDWKQTIDDDLTLQRMAAFTRKLAASENRPIIVMWFLDCGGTNVSIPLVPWYHEEARAPQEEVVFRRNSRDEIVRISTEADLLEFERRAPRANDAAGHLIVEICPVEDRAIRNESFARRIGEKASTLGAMVNLNGASLSHIYYVLQRSGARVAVRNSSDYNSREERHGKLVRDRIPENVAAGGEIARVAQLSRSEALAALKIKLVEEAFETRDAQPENLAEELADVFEVLEALLEQAGLTKQEIEAIKERKRSRRGGFGEHRMLVSTSATSNERTQEWLLPFTQLSSPGRVLPAEAPPLEVISRGASDLRRHDQFIELVDSASVSLTHPQWRIESSRSVDQLPATSSTRIEWSIEGSRSGTALRLRLKIRIGDTQLELPLSQGGPEN